jgi:hypothetical protein
MRNELTKIDIDKMTNQVVETFLPKGTKDKVMVFHIVLDVSHYGEEEVNVRRHLQIGYYAPNNYIQVGYRMDDEDPFTHVANHDSGWREGAKRALEAALDEMNEELKEKGVTEEDERDFHPWVHFGMRGIKVIENTHWLFEETNGHYEGFYHLEKIV